MHWKPNKINLFSLFFTLFSIIAYSQEIRLKGNVQYDNSPLKDINVFNKTTQKGTATNDKGAFELNVALGDSILFSSLSFQNRIIKVSSDHMTKQLMTVYLDLGFTELDEVELEQWFRLELGDIAIDERARLNNDQTDSNRPPNASYFVDPTAKHSGISARSIYRAITKKSRLSKAEQKKLDDKLNSLKEQFPEKLKASYGEEFFTITLSIPEDEVNLFLDYCNGNGLADYFDKSEFLIHDFLIKQSNAYTLGKN